MKIILVLVGSVQLQAMLNTVEMTTGAHRQLNAGLNSYAHAKLLKSMNTEQDLFQKCNDKSCYTMPQRNQHLEKLQARLKKGYYERPEKTY